jgi:hypothetical protein
MSVNTPAHIEDRNILSDLETESVVKNEHIPHCSEFGKKGYPGSFLHMPLSTEMLQLAAPFMRGDALFNSQKRFYQGSKQVDTMDLVKWSIESVCGNPVKSDSAVGNTMLTFEFQGQTVHAQTEWNEGGSITLQFYSDPKITFQDKPDIIYAKRPPQIAFDFCQTYGAFLRDAMLTSQRTIDKPKFAKHPF